jgi:hypothetical protein
MVVQDLSNTRDRERDSYNYLSESLNLQERK